MATEYHFKTYYKLLKFINTHLLLVFIVISYYYYYHYTICIVHKFNHARVRGTGYHILIIITHCSLPRNPSSS